MARSGLGQPDKPIGSFLFSGPTGVGKTEVAKQLAFILGIELIRFDMSRVHGAPCGQPPDRRASGLRRLRPGRPADRGGHQEAACGAAARRDREGAPGHLQRAAAGDGPRHADRQQRAQGRLPQRHHHHDDQRGRRGAEQGDRSASPTRAKPGDEMADIKRLFTPEFRNRLDATVSFKALDEEIILRVVDKFLLQLESAAGREEGRGHLHRRACASTWPRRASIR